MRPIPYLRVYDASIINYLKYEVLPVYFTERIVNEPLVYSDSLGGYVTQASMVPNPTSMGRGWALFDEVVVGNRVIVDATTEQSTQVTVSGADTYQIDYPGGRIINPNTAPMSVSYSWYYVSLVEGWPGSEPPPTPIVAVDVDRTVKEGYQLGGGTKDILHGSVYVFASSETEKKEITDVIYQSLYNKSLAIKNWHEGSYLDFDGTYTGFQPEVIPGISSGAFVDVEANFNGPRADWSEVNRYRSRVKFVFEVYKDE